MYSILRTFRINRIFAARTKFWIEWSHYGPDSVFDSEKHGCSTVPLHSILRALCLVYVRIRMYIRTCTYVYVCV